MKKKITQCFVSFLLAWFLWSAAEAAFVSNIKTSDGLEIGSHQKIMQNSTKNVTNESRAFDGNSQKQNSDNIIKNQIFDKFEAKLSKEGISTETVSKRAENQVKTTIEPHHDSIYNKEQVLNQDGMKLNLKNELKNELVKGLNFQKPDEDIDKTDQEDFEKDLYEPVFKEVGSKKNAKSKLFDEGIELMSSSSEDDSDEIWDELLQNIDLNKDKVSMHSDIHIRPPILVDDASYDDGKEDVSMHNILKRKSLLNWSIDSKSSDYDHTVPTPSSTEHHIESQDQPLSRDSTEWPPQPSEPSSSSESPEVSQKTMLSNTVHNHMLNRLDPTEWPPQPSEPSSSSESPEVSQKTMLSNTVYNHMLNRLDPTEWSPQPSEPSSSSESPEVSQKTMQSNTVYNHMLNRLDPTEWPPQPSEPSSSSKSPEVSQKTMQSNTVHNHMFNRLDKRRIGSRRRPRLAPTSSEDQASSEAQSSEQSVSVSMPTSSTICKPPSHLIHSDIQCTETNSETVCEQQCVHGHTTKEGIRRTHRCNKEEYLWRPSRLVSDCKPYVDCTITLKSGGHKRCYGNYKNQGPWCYLSCDKYADKKRVKGAWYQCNIHGAWDPPLPRCAIPGSRARLVQRPRIVHTDDGSHYRKPPHIRKRKKRNVAENESEYEKNSESEEESNDEAEKENEDIFI